ncbi:hypothetical protein [Aquirhabdus parva]|uniref:Uncharacterized protein n=1 Tax=Aquirhabdus parva TaxID=2283318 RepID=A0A345P968_9GAMM|nr:hypothetical protein [Aquirhabdus parva]AXI03827.1 hypothetical protein HYN46_13885 [Aquirhabdus parva]
MLKKVIISVLLLCVVMAYQYWPSTPLSQPQTSAPLPVMQAPTPKPPSSVQTNIAPAPFVHNLNHELALEQAYQSSHDLHGFYLKYHNSTNPDEQLFALRAAELCAQFIASPEDSLTLQIQSLPNRNRSPEAQLAIQTLFARCSAFSHEFTTAKAFRDEVARLSNEVIQGESYFGTEMRVAIQQATGEGSKNQIKPLIRAVLLSKEPEAINGISSFMLPIWKTAAQNDTDSPSSPARVNALALMLATCELGRDCSKDANDSIQHCTCSNECQGLVEASIADIPLDLRQVVLSKKSEYVRAIQQGNLQILGLD